jgi:uncharacterized repeat protein (TIGR03803 family)
MKTNMKGNFIKTCLLAAALLVLSAVLPAFGTQAGAVLATLHSFQAFPNGENPQAELVQGNDGNFYGTTLNGGTNNAGTVFKVGTNGALTTLYFFTGFYDGGNPYAGLVQGSDGNLYGTTQQGGANGYGTVFKISTDGALTSLYSFGGNDGANPQAALVQGGDGYFYGTTVGTVFRISTNGALTTLHFFTGNDGAYPLPDL